MIVTFAPSEGDKRTYIFRPDEMDVSKGGLMSVEAEDIESHTGMTFEEAKAALIKGSVKARRAVVFVFEKRTHAPLRFSDFQPTVGQITVEFERSELLAMQAEAETSPRLTEDERSDALDAITTLLAGAGEETPKAPSVTGSEPL